MASAATQNLSGHSTTFEPLSTVPAGITKHHVQTRLHYYQEAEDGSPPAPTYVDKPETYERPVHPFDVTVHDVRGEAGNYTLDGNGFQVHSHTSAEKEFLDDETIKAVYYPETEQLLKDV